MVSRLKMISILKIVVQLASILMLIHKVNCLSNSSTSGNQTSNESEGLIQMTELLANELINLKDPITQSIQNSDQEKTQLLLKRLQDLWQQIKLSFELEENSDPFRLYELRNLTSHLLFIAKARHCELPDETFYKPLNKCLPVGIIEPCPENMILNDGPENEGFCDCILSPEYLFSFKTGHCHKQNSQGPCQNGEWFILEGRTPQCKKIPSGCPADGKHVYWSPEITLAKQCWEMGTQGPCSLNEILLGTGGQDVICGPDFHNIFQIQSGTNIAPPRRKLCEVGSFRDQFLRCRPSFF